MVSFQFPTPDHDHKVCITRSLERARAAYRNAGGCLTELREGVLRELAASHAALGAYDIIQHLSARGRRVAPISVYRVLESLLEVGLVHRIESRNAYMACHTTHDLRRPVLFMVCESCGAIAESVDAKLHETLGRVAAVAKFTLGQTVLEMTGLCENCREALVSEVGRHGA